MEARIPVVRSIFNLLIVGLAALTFNGLPGTLGVLRSATDRSTFEPLQASALAAHLAYLNLWWLCAFGLHGANLLLQRWTRITRGLAFGVYLLGTIVLARVVVGVPLFRLPAANLAVKGALAIMAVVALAGAIQQLREFLREPPASVGVTGQKGG
jgi:hypothetical protein